MVQKRKSGAGTPHETPDVTAKHDAKRMRTSESAQSPAVKPPQLSQAEKAKLSGWLDKREEDGLAIMDITLAPTGGNRRRSKTSKWHSETFSLNGIPYSEVEYSINQNPKWELLTKYRKCTVGEETFEPGQCILVDGGETAEADDGVGVDTLSQWKAHLHEIRAVDANHVYLRVSWLMRPQDLDDRTGGAKPYHGRYELIPSNHMSIINAMSVNGSVEVKHWDEQDDTEVPEAEEYFWRQTCDITTMSLSKCRVICKCEQPHNPDEMIVHCNKCSTWLHTRCIAVDAVERAQANPAQGSEIAEHPSTNGTRKEAKVKAKTKRTSAVNKDGEDKLIEADVQVKSAIGSEGRPRSKITITDRRLGEPIVEEQDLACLVCKEKIE